MNKFVEYSAEVLEALQNKQPIVALESTVITHGMPYPHNLETAKELEQIARAQQVIPATVAIMNGKIKIGLSSDELQQLAEDRTVHKASLRDIPFYLEKGVSAGTTVAATLFCIRNTAIKVFATGGIGGVHRGEDMDISADLIELSRTPIAVVCAGAKSILDLPRTLEFLETFSIPVYGYQTNCLPAFYCATSPYELPARVDDVETLAKVLNTHWELGINSGALITNPIPVRDAIAPEVIEPVIAAALIKANQQNISGKAMTPFLLKEVATVTTGKSLTANIALIKNNVELGSKLALAMH